MKIILLFISFFLIDNSSSKKNEAGIVIEWVNKLEGDFSFANKYSIKCNAWCYEWAGTRDIIAVQKGKNTVHCYTLCNASTHCSLHLDITNDYCIPKIFLTSIVRGRDKIYGYDSGYIKIDRNLWNKKILKAEFDIHFKNDEDTKHVFWKGKIFKKIT